MVLCWLTRLKQNNRKIEVNSSTLAPQIKFAAEIAKHGTVPFSSHPTVPYDARMELGMHLVLCTAVVDILLCLMVTYLYDCLFY